MIGKVILVAMIIFIGYGMINSILYDTINLLNDRGFYSYSLTHTQTMLISFQIDHFNFDMLSPLRAAIWENTKNIIKSDGYYFIGSGTGSFQDRYGFYKHNIYYDLRLQYGILRLATVVMIAIKSILKIKNSKNDVKLLGIFFLCL